VREQRKRKALERNHLAKVPTGIGGLDEITEGGLPRGRPTLIAGPFGTGKTLLAMQFLVNRASKHGESGVFVTFEETANEMIINFASLGFNLDKLIEQKKLAIECVSMHDAPVTEAGAYNLDGLIIRLDNAISSIDARHIVLDPVAMLFTLLSNVPLLRVELLRLLQWLKSKGVTTIITSERQENTFPQGLESYVSDCVILLGNRISDTVATRHLRVAKYRGSRHASDEFPFYIGERGLSVLPVTSVMPDYEATSERITTGIERLDTLLNGGGYYRRSSIMVSGDAGTGKTSVAAHFARATCERGERCLYMAFEEARDQVIRNMRSIGTDLECYVKTGLLDFRTMRPTQYGLETHLVVMEKLVDEFKPAVVIIDPISTLSAIGSARETKSMLARFVDFLKARQVTALFTFLRQSGADVEIGVSSVMDIWISLRMVESNGEQNRLLHIIKARGMAHSRQVHEFVLSEKGVQLLDVYVGPSGVLTGSARVAQENRERAEKLERQRGFERQQSELKRKKLELETRMAAFKVEIKEVQDELELGVSEEKADGRTTAEGVRQMTRIRQADKRTEESD
jgi:circadian clock protein KaiC